MEARPRFGAACALVLAVLACERRREVVPVRADPVPSASASVAGSDLRAEAVKAFLAPFAVSDERPVAKVLYSWTTDAQVDELDKTKILLSRSESATSGPAAIDREIAGRPASDAIARLLRDRAYAKKRFAWTAPWATALGMTGTSYGDRLMRIELADDAIVARFMVQSGTWELFDMQGQHVDEKTLLAHPERLAAIYHASYDVAPGKPAYREYVIVNESRVAEWSVSTEAIDHLLDESADTVDKLAKTTPVDVAAFRANVVPGFRTALAKTEVDAWSATLCFATDDMTPTPQYLEPLAKKLRAAPRKRTPIVHRPTMTFRLLGVGSPPVAHKKSMIIW